VAGVDEAGRAPLAGPVVAAAVILAAETRIAGLDDSKLLPPEERERLFVLIQARAVAVGVGMADAEVIDRVNILEATRLAMQAAVAALQVVPELVLTDFVRLAGLDCPQRNLVRGDQRSATVAAASIIAKVTRDRIMAEYAIQYPGYGWETNRGYGTPHHWRALHALGPTPLHRRSFPRVRAAIDAVLRERGDAAAEIGRERALAVAVAGERIVEEIREFLAPTFAKWWLPDAVEVVPQIPRTSAGKFRKSELRDRFKARYGCATA